MKILLNRSKHLKCYFSFIFLVCLVSLMSAQDKEISTSLYLTGNTGIVKKSKAKEILAAIVKTSQNDENAVFVGLGNQTRKDGFPNNKKEREAEKKFLEKSLMKPLESFNGRRIYIPGHHEWNKKGNEAIDDLESFLQDNSDSEFWPNDGCPIERESLSDEVELVMVDSEWYLENWDNYPYINNDCEIKTREDFFAKFKDELKDEQSKTIIVAVHHPVLSASRKGFIGRMGGFTKQNFYSPELSFLSGRLETLASQFEDVIFVSGNHRNLQFLSDDGIPQIISGATARTKKTRPDEDEGYFGSDNHGFVKLNVFKDGTSEVLIYELDKNDDAELVFKADIELKKEKLEELDYHDTSEFGSHHKASIYTNEETDVTKLYKWFWGDHYRQIYSRSINAPVLSLDSLSNDLHAVRAGGGSQSRTLRLANDDGHEYNIRELRKSAVRFLQTSIKDHYIVDFLKNTVAEELVQDFYTTAHPYAPFAVGSLLDQIDIYHANPEIVYVPKQKNLGRFNNTYGDKLYMFEEHVGDENKSFDTFGNANDIISTKDLYLELQDDKDSKIDEELFIRARLFDMLIGDWDRHADQWRWALQEQEDGTKLYKPIPRDRDQAFPKYDGPLVSLAKFGIPLLRKMQTYKPTIKNIEWFNYSGHVLDQSLIKHSSLEDWEKQAKFIQNKISDDAIENAFGDLLPDVQDESIENIKKILKQRRGNLLQISEDYYNFFKKHEIVTATNEDNRIEIERKKNGITQIRIFEGEELTFDRTYTKKETKEIWLYSLDGDDEIKITGEGSRLIMLKIMGGEEHDIYDFENPKNAKVYDYKSKNNSFKNVTSKFLTDSYDINNYNPNKRKFTSTVLLPSIDYSGDRGFEIGLQTKITHEGLVKNPFTSQHEITANYMALSDGVELEYEGEFAHFFYNWNFGIDAYFSSGNYLSNFFGIGNNTTYDKDEIDRDFNRTKLKRWSVSPSLIYRKDDYFRGHAKLILESNKLIENTNSFSEQYFSSADNIYETQLYVGAEAGINYNTKGMMIALPKRGIELDLTAGYKRNIENQYKNEFSYIKPSISFVYPIHESGAATLATKAEGEFILGDDYEFYHAATIGGNASLRGFRNERFMGKNAFYQTTDLRVGITKFKTDFIPLRIGASAGFDYGRVWSDVEETDKWHNSYGGSVFINGFNALTANIGYYVSKEDNRLVFSFGFKF